VIQTIEVNKACDLCNCLWGTDGNQVCDPALTAKYIIPVISFKCPKGYPATRGYGNGNPAWFNNTRRAVMERIAKVERERRVLSELVKNGKMRAEILAELAGVGKREIPKTMNKLKRLGRVKALAGSGKWKATREGLRCLG